MREMFVNVWYRHRISPRRFAAWAGYDVKRFESWLRGDAFLPPGAIDALIEIVGEEYWEGFCGLYHPWVPSGGQNYDLHDDELPDELAAHLDDLQAPWIDELAPLMALEPGDAPTFLQMKLERAWGLAVQDIALPLESIGIAATAFDDVQLGKAKVSAGLYVRPDGVFMSNGEVVPAADICFDGIGRGVYEFGGEIFCLQDAVFESYLGEIPVGWVPVVSDGSYQSASLRELVLIRTEALVRLWKLHIERETQRRDRSGAGLNARVDQLSAKRVMRLKS